MPARSSRVLLDLNSPAIQDTLFSLELSDLRQVIGWLRRLRAQDWQGVYGHPGFHWEAIDHIQTPRAEGAVSLSRLAALIEEGSP